MLHGFGIILVVQIKAGIVVCRGRHAKLYLFQQIGFADDDIKGVDCCNVQFLAEVIAAFMERHFCLFQKFIVRIFRLGGEEKRPFIVAVKGKLRVVQRADHLLNIFPHQLVPYLGTTATGDQDSLFNGDHADLVVSMFFVVELEFHEIFQLRFLI